MQDPRAKSRLILASSSPRRRELLQKLGVPFEVVEPHGVDEQAASGSAPSVARNLAVEKAERVLWTLSATRPGEGDRWVVLGADTVVVLGEGVHERVLGKPADLNDARGMLRALGGRTHQVWTGLAVAQAGSPARAALERTEVTFRPLSAEDIERYLSTGDAEGKAGAYGIQGAGARLVSGFRGCYYNVVGLPLALTARLLEDFLPLAPAAFDCDCPTQPLQRAPVEAFPRCSSH